MPVTPEQGQMIAALVIAMRPTGAPRWDHAGVMAQIKKVAHLSLGDVVLAARNAAVDRSLITPGAIGNPQAPCWQHRVVGGGMVQLEPAPEGGFCADCGKPERICRSIPASVSAHTFVSPAENERRRRARSDT